jgi:hypothetical protein
MEEDIMTVAATMWTDTCPSDALSNVGPDTAVFSSFFSGEAATEEVLKYMDKKVQLIGLINVFFSHGFSSYAPEAAKITWPTAVASKNFLITLPNSKALPRISPDGEGALIMAWEQNTAPVLLTIDDLRLHMVTGATTHRAKYYDNMPFDGSFLIAPKEILDVIPNK